MITLVCGFGRCGSSLVMQMLHQGGMRVGGEWPTFEDERATREAGGEWIDEYEGAAVKVLDPEEWTPPPGRDYRAVWLDRDRKEQAKSWVKVQKHWGGSGGRVPAIRKMLKQRRAGAMRTLEGLGAEVLAIRFENILRRPDVAAGILSNFVGGGLDEHAMAAVVATRRPECLKGVLEESLLTLGPPRVATPNTDPHP